MLRIHRAVKRAYAKMWKIALVIGKSSATLDCVRFDRAKTVMATTAINAVQNGSMVSSVRPMRAPMRSA